MNIKSLTIEKGCFNCRFHSEKDCNLRYTNGKYLDTMEININDITGEKYRCGCCCGDYKYKAFIFR